MAILARRESRYESGATYIELIVSDSFDFIKEDPEDGELLKLEAFLIDIDPRLLCEKVISLSSREGPRTYMTGTISCLRAETPETMDYLKEVFQGIKEKGLGYFSDV